MSAAAGAPPPPPPPPPHMPSFSDNLCDNLFNLLPAELLLMICEYAGSGNLMNLTLAIYPTLEQHRIAPQLTANTYLSIARAAQTATATRRTLVLPPSLDRMPMELWLYVARDLEPIDVLSMMLAIGTYPQESLTPETATRMRSWCRRPKRTDAS